MVDRFLKIFFEVKAPLIKWISLKENADLCETVNEFVNICTNHVKDVFRGNVGILNRLEQLLKSINEWLMIDKKYDLLYSIKELQAILISQRKSLNIVGISC